MMSMSTVTYLHDNCHVGGFVWQIFFLFTIACCNNRIFYSCHSTNIFQLANDHWPYWATFAELNAKWIFFVWFIDSMCIDMLVEMEIFVYCMQIFGVWEDFSWLKMLWVKEFYRILRMLLIFYPNIFRIKLKLNFWDGISRKISFS